MLKAWKLSWYSVLDACTGPTSVANYGFTFVFDIRHPIISMVIYLGYFLGRVRWHKLREKHFEGHKKSALKEFERC
jgi:hypothetical protein